MPRIHAKLILRKSKPFSQIVSGRDLSESPVPDESFKELTLKNIQKYYNEVQ